MSERLKQLELGGAGVSLDTAENTPTSYESSLRHFGGDGSPQQQSHHQQHSQHQQQMMMMPSGQQQGQQQGQQGQQHYQPQNPSQLQSAGNVCLNFIRRSSLGGMISSVASSPSRTHPIRELRRQFSHESATAEYQQAQQQQQKNQQANKLWNFRANFGTSFDSGTGTISGPTPPPPVSRGRNLPMPKVPSGARMEHLPQRQQPSLPKPSLRRLPSSESPAHQVAHPVPSNVPNFTQRQTSLPASTSAAQSFSSGQRKLPIARQKSRELPFIEDVLSGQAQQLLAEQQLQSSSSRPSLHLRSSYSVSFFSGFSLFSSWVLKSYLNNLHFYL